MKLFITISDLTQNEESGLAKFEDEANIATDGCVDFREYIKMTFQDIIKNAIGHTPNIQIVFIE